MVDNPLMRLRDGITGDDPVSVLQRASLASAAAYFFPQSEAPKLSVTVSGGTLDSWESGHISLAVQDAATKMGRLIADPTATEVRKTRKHREQATLQQYGQVGNTLIFHFARPFDSISDNTLDTESVSSLSELAAASLVDILPQDTNDYGTLDSILARRIVERDAVNELVTAVCKVGKDLTLTYSDRDRHQRGSTITRNQAEILEDSLRESELIRTKKVIKVRVDGVRSSRRTFYFDGINGNNGFYGAITAEQVAVVRDHIGQIVQATVEEVVSTTRTGHRSRPSYSLLDLAVEQELRTEGL